MGAIEELRNEMANLTRSYEEVVSSKERIKKARELERGKKDEMVTELKNIVMKMGEEIKSLGELVRGRNHPKDKELKRFEERGPESLGKKRSGSVGGQIAVTAEGAVQVVQADSTRRTTTTRTFAQVTRDSDAQVEATREGGNKEKASGEVGRERSAERIFPQPWESRRELFIPAGGDQRWDNLELAGLKSVKQQGAGVLLVFETDKDTDEALANRFKWGRSKIVRRGYSRRALTDRRKGMVRFEVASGMDQRRDGRQLHPGSAGYRDGRQSQSGWVGYG